eukprot:GHVU01055325.1.p2 GENE.GHVU01055325.1~~GHVU01055325.1.p2  ORF type:complete len:113 (+),score=20.21 GHVU01055325.1:542-880(+)
MSVGRSSIHRRHTYSGGRYSLTHSHAHRSQLASVRTHHLAQDEARGCCGHFGLPGEAGLRQLVADAGVGPHAPPGRQTNRQAGRQGQQEEEEEEEDTGRQAAAAAAAASVSD